MTKQEKRLDILWSKAVRTRDKFTCQRCGKYHKQTHAAHIYSRVNKSTRWDANNGITLCYYCHIVWSHRQPVEFAEWVKKKIGTKKAEALRRKANRPKRYTARQLTLAENKLKKILIQGEVMS